VSPIGGAPGNLSTSLSNVARLRHIQNLYGFSTPTTIAQYFIMPCTISLVNVYPVHVGLVQIAHI
jgi:hypothetical protein